jgi:hypothetical protein
VESAEFPEPLGLGHGLGHVVRVRTSMAAKSQIQVPNPGYATDGTATSRPTFFFGSTVLPKPTHRWECVTPALDPVAARLFGFGLVQRSTYTRTHAHTHLVNVQSRLHGLIKIGRSASQSSVSECLLAQRLKRQTQAPRTSVRQFATVVPGRLLI